MTTAAAVFLNIPEVSIESLDKYQICRWSLGVVNTILRLVFLKSRPWSLKYGNLQYHTKMAVSETPRKPSLYVRHSGSLLRWPGTVHIPMSKATNLGTCIINVCCVMVYSIANIAYMGGSILFATAVITEIINRTRPGKQMLSSSKSHTFEMFTPVVSC